jgi:cytochrome b involved in lipid metabolism
MICNIYTLDEVAKHSSKASCWMVINGKVYDATSFIKNHPGGPIIATGCGKDASILFNQRPNTAKTPHPDQAKTVLDKLYIGELKK